MTPENFSKMVIEENDLDQNFEREITTSIQRAITTHKPYQIRSKEMLRVIELDIRVGDLCLKDRFQWDIAQQDNSPEEFAV